ncbi:unnamed protein product [Effrenium voratum]|nr:unnamed protein product [Effrenium voratum]
MGACLARTLDCCDVSCLRDQVDALLGYVSPQPSGLPRVYSESAPDLLSLDSPMSPGSSRSQLLRMVRARTWSTENFKRGLRRFASSASPKRVKADELDFGDMATHDRARNIMHLWKVRGACRPITDFYDFDCHLGEGAFGSVSKWRVKGSSTSVAVKQIRWQAIWHGFFRNRAAERLIRKELKLLLVLDNPFIIKFREWFEDMCKGIFFVMEVCTGPSLQDILEEVCGLPEEQRKARLQKLRRHFREVAYAISYIHSFDPPVVHRDLKPDNILLADCSEFSTARVIDFGLACLKTEEENMAVGTMVFMAPETFINAKVDLSQQTDIWALGVILTWITTAIVLGSLQHPCLDVEEGEEFGVKWISLYTAFKDKAPWNRSLVEGHPEVALILDKVLRYEPEERCKASDILQEAWICVTDPAVSACAELLERGTLLYNLRTFGELSDLEKKIVFLVADHAPDNQLALLRRTFRALDLGNDGQLDLEELREGFRKHDVDISEELVRELFDEVDIDDNNVISYHEWLAATIGPKIMESESALAACFRRLDPEDNGYISREDLIRAVGQGADEVLRLDDDSFFLDEPRLSFEDFKVVAHRIGEKRASTSYPARTSQSEAMGKKRNSAP